MRRIILAFSHFDTGGLQTFIIRVCQWCRKHNIDSLVFYETIDQNMKRICKEENIENFGIYSIKEIGKKLREKDYLYDDNVIITFELPEFLMFERIRKKYLKNQEVKHYLYNVSVNGMIFGREFTGKIGKIIYKFYQKISIMYCNNNQLLFMDKETRMAAYTYYCLQNDINNVYLLPMFISKEPEYNIAKTRKKILTVSRADFPYKGYLIGLIDDFDKLCEKQDVYLQIVSFGKDVGKLKEKIKNSKYHERISFFEGATLEKIRELLLESYVYIGMGTTVLDAADLGVPSIVIFHSTMKNIASGFFHENPTVIGRCGDGKPAIDLLNEILDCSIQEYKSVREKTYIGYKNNYDIECFMKRILSIHNNKKVYLKNRDWIFHSLLFKLRSFRRKLLKLK